MYTLYERKYYMKTTLIHVYLLIASIICIIVPVVFIYATLFLISLLLFYLITGDDKILYRVPVFSGYHTAGAWHKGIDTLQSKRKSLKKSIYIIFRERRIARYRIADFC